MGNEESLVGFPVKQVVPALVSTVLCVHTVIEYSTVPMSSVFDKMKLKAAEL